VRLIEAPCVVAVQLPHSVRQLLSRGFEDEVVVRAHQAVGAAVPVEGNDREAQELEEIESVKIGLEEHRSANRSSGGVEEAVSELRSSDPRHRHDAICVAAGNQAKRNKWRKPAPTQ